MGERFGNRLVPRMYAQINELRRLIRERGDAETQAAWDAVEEHIDAAYQWTAERAAERK